MTRNSALATYLRGEIDALEVFSFVGVVPAGKPLHFVEVMRCEDAGLEVRVPGRPRIVPELPVNARAALRDRGFSSEDASDPGNPWIRKVADADEAVNLLQSLTVEVFGEKADVTLDVVHRAEHDARVKLATARERIEAIVADIQGQPAGQDADGDYVLPIGEVQVTVAPRASPSGDIVVRVFAITNVDVSVTPELGLFLARLNFGFMFGRFALDVERRSIWFDETLLGEQFREEELRFAVQVVASTADEWDDRLQQMFGGSTYQQVLAGRSAEVPPPRKPGSGGGLYL